MRKIRLYTPLSKILLTLAIAGSVLTPALRADFPALFYEDWSGFAAGTTASTGGQWQRNFTGGGNYALFTVVDYPSENPTRQLIDTNTNPGSGSGLRTILTNDTFTLAEGAGLSYNINLMMRATTQYTRYAILAGNGEGDTPYERPSYLIDIYGDKVELKYSNNLSDGTTGLASYSFQSGEFNLNEFYQFSLNITSIGGSYQIDVLQGTKTLISIVDDKIDLGDSIRLGFGVRKDVEAYVGDLSLTEVVIPESSHVALMVGMVVAIGVYFQRRHRN